MRIELLDEVSSTNDYIKRYLGGRENVTVSAVRQTGGKGTKGRSFVSEAGGVYLSALTFYKGFPAKDAFLVMAHAAVSVCRTAEDFGVRPEIKWANDVFVSGRKLSGILIENGVAGAFLDYSIVGIGLNACNSLAGVEDIAVNLSEAAGKYVSAEEARERLIFHYSEKDTFEDYLSYVSFLGREVEVSEGNERYQAKALRILPDGRLEIESNHAVRALSAAEIKIKL